MLKIIRQLVSTALSIGFVLSLCAQANDPLDFAKTIDHNTIREHVYKLASKEFQGREAGTEQRHNDA